MRSVLVLVFLLLLIGEAYSQESMVHPPKTKAEYMALSKSQRTAGFIFLGGGVALLAYAAPGDVTFDTLPFLVIGGTVFTLTSIPFFISAGKNRKRAEKAATFLEIHKLPSGPLTGHSSTVTSLSIHLKL